jgi:Mg2+ and Co2+ transporter CorA
VHLSQVESPLLINCAAYQDGTKLADIPVAQISDYLARPGAFVWVALRDASDEELATMQQEFGLHDLAVEDARHGHQRPKVDEYGDTIGTAIQVNLSMVTIEESEVTKRFAAWAGISAVATAFAGVWGMNFEHMPELKWHYGYPLALSAIVGSRAALWWRFRKAGWL